MLITLKTLQQQTFKIEIDPSETVQVLKEAIEKEKGHDFAAENQKLIYAGKILDNAKKVEEYGIDNFVVIMVTKPKPKSVAESKPVEETQPPAASAADAASKPAEVTEEPAATKEEKKEEEPEKKEAAASTAPVERAVPETPAPATTTATVPSHTETSTSSSGAGAGLSLLAAESTLVTGTDYEAAINEMALMGFERDQVVRAMRASFNNPDRAMDMLLSNTVPAEVPPQQAQQAEGSEGMQVEMPSGSSGSGSGDALAFLRNQPTFQNMRRLVQENPSALPGLIQQIQTVNPELFQLIRQNQARFVQMLNEGGEQEGGGGGGGGAPAPAGGAPGEQIPAHLNPAAGGGGGGPQMPGNVLQITQQEKEAIERLKALGFPEVLVIQAYFACEKNEDLAANFLLAQNFDDDES